MIKKYEHFGSMRYYIKPEIGVPMRLTTLVFDCEEGALLAQAVYNYLLLGEDTNHVAEHIVDTVKQIKYYCDHNPE